MGAEDAARKRVRGSGGAGACEGDDACVPSAGEELEALEAFAAQGLAPALGLSLVQPFPAQQLIAVMEQVLQVGQRPAARAE